MSDNPSNLTAVTAKVFDNGATPIKVMQPANQAANVTTNGTPATTAAYTTAASIVAIIAPMQVKQDAVIACLINAGLMKAS